MYFITVTKVDGEEHTDMNLPKLEKRARQRQKLMESSSSYLPDLVGKMNTASDNHSARLTISAAANESSDLTGWAGAIIPHGMG